MEYWQNHPIRRYCLVNYLPAIVLGSCALPRIDISLTDYSVVLWGYLHAPNLKKRVFDKGNGFDKLLYPPYQHGFHRPVGSRCDLCWQSSGITDHFS
jgi:hypothetical protein